jgi:hypothetical protein
VQNKKVALPKKIATPGKEERPPQQGKNQNHILFITSSLGMPD